jgi:ketosteroid isomerase-like protein
METNAIRIHSIEALEVEYLVREHLAAFGRGDFDAWGAAFAPDVFFTAADPEEVFFKREDAVAEMHRDFDEAFDDGLQIEVEPVSFHVGLSPDRMFAWSAAPLRYTVSFQGEINSFTLRHTSLLSNVGQHWSIRATHYSLTLPESRIQAALAGGYLPAPNTIDDARPAGAKNLIEQFMHQIDDLSTAMISQDAFVFGPFPEQDAEGEDAVRALFVECGSSWSGLRLRPDGVRAELVSGSIGWVGANVEAVYADGRVPMPLRWLAIYQRERERWSVVHAHISVGIPDELAE